MKPIDKDLMTGMISILNQALESKNCGTPIMSDENINIRLADLKEFEDETGMMFVNSPNCEINLESVVNIQGIKEDSLKECKSVAEVIEYANQKEMIVYLDIVGTDMIVTYTNGYLTNVQVNDGNSKTIIKLLNVPYKIDKEGVYIVKGKISHADKPTFYVNNILEGGSGNLKLDLYEARVLNFDVVPFWVANSLNPKSLQDTINYVMDYAVDDDLDCESVVFKFSENQFSKILNFVGCYYSNSKTSNS